VFWTFAAGALLFAALITFRPLLRGKSLWRPAALALTFALPAAALWLYTQVGRPEAITLDSPRQPTAAAEHANSGQEMDAMVASLRAKLTDSAADLDGWILLARTLKTMQRYGDAQAALETAYRIAPDNSHIMVELAEARMFASGEANLGADSISLLQRALDLDPGQQKALWLLGIAAAQSGDFESAVTYWETLLEVIEPGSSAAQSVQNQIDEARNRLGSEVQAPQPAAEPAPSAAPTPAAAGWAGIPLRLSAGEDVPGGVLYVMIRPAGMAVGPPIGVRRVTNPAFPLEITITDSDSMLKERQISSESELQLQARLSLSGTPAASPGDWESETVVVPLNAAGPVELSLNRQVQ
jgi:cytochrome c-type biogenesis protein CcmH